MEITLLAGVVFIILGDICGNCSDIHRLHRIINFGHKGKGYYSRTGSCCSDVNGNDHFDRDPFK